MMNINQNSISGENLFIRTLIFLTKFFEKRFTDILDCERRQDKNRIILKESIKEKFMNA